MLRGSLLAGSATLWFISPLALAIEYSAESIEARVVDAQTQAPIEGVIVVAHWQLEGGLEGGNVLGQVKVLETGTDASGVFKFPAWGPVQIPRGLPANARLKDLDPEMILFKPGYKVTNLKNRKTFEQTRGFAPYTRTSDWNHQTITLKQISGNVSEIAREVDVLNSLIAFSIHPMSRCAWESMPLIIESMHNFKKQLKVAGRGLLGQLVDEELIENDERFVISGCASPKSLFGTKLK